MHHLTRFCLARPHRALFAIGVVTVVLGMGLPRVRPEYGYRVLVGDDHPAIVALDGLIERFGGGLPIQIGWECGPGLPCADVFDAASLEMAHDVSRALSGASGVQRVTSPSSAPLLVPAQDGFAIRRFVEDGARAPDADRLAARALDDPLWRGSIVSPDGRAGVIVVQPTDTRNEVSLQVTGAIETALAPHRERGFEFYLVGDPVQNLIVGEDLARSTAKLIPFTVIVIALVFYGLSRSWRHVLIGLGTMGVALLWTYGALGWLGWPQDGVIEVLAPAILVVGVCDAIHFLSRTSSALAEARCDSASCAPAPTLVDTARSIGGPCVITTITTASAFLSFTTSDLQTFERFGAIAAFGVVACLVLTFSLMPLLLARLPGSSRRADVLSEAWRPFLVACLNVGERRAVAILGGTLVAGLLCSMGWYLHLRVDTDWTESLGEESRVVINQRFMEERLGQSSSLEVEIGIPPGSVVQDPRTMHRIAGMAGFLEGIEGLGQSTSLLDVIARVNRLLHDDDPAYERYGDSVEANAEIIEMIGFDDPGLVRNWLSFDGSTLRLSVSAREEATSSRGLIVEAIREYVAEQFPASWQVTLGGDVATQVEWVRDLQNTQIRSFPTAFVVIFLMVSWFLKSFRLGLAAMVPTAMPVVITLGAMGWAGISLDLGRAMVAAVLLGIAVDDSIHILREYERYRAGGSAPREAIRGAILDTGRAVVTTSIALSFGFLTMMASAWQSIASFGFFVALAIMGALVASIFVLPALIFVFAGRQTFRLRTPAPGDFV